MKTPLPFAPLAVALKTVVLGDSIAYGQYLEDGEKPWPSLLKAGYVVNKGVCSDTTQLMLDRFNDDVAAESPAFVIIQSGHNDANRWDSLGGNVRVTPSEFENNLVELVERSQALDASVVLCTITLTRKTTTGYEERLHHYDNIIRFVAYETGAELADVRETFGREKQVSRLLLPDGLHLSAAGHRVYAKTVQNTLLVAV